MERIERLNEAKRISCVAGSGFYSGSGIWAIAAITKKPTDQTAADPDQYIASSDGEVNG